MKKYQKQQLINMASYELVHQIISQSGRTFVLDEVSVLAAKNNKNDPALLIVHGFMFKYGQYEERNLGKSKTRFNKAWKLIQNKTDGESLYLKGIILKHRAVRENSNTDSDSVEQYIKAIEAGFTPAIYALSKSFMINYQLESVYTRLLNALKSQAEKDNLDAIMTLIFGHMNKLQFVHFANCNFPMSYFRRFYGIFKQNQYKEFSKYYILALKLNNPHIQFIDAKERMKTDPLNGIKQMCLASKNGSQIATHLLKTEPILTNHLVLYKEYSKVSKLYQDLRVTFDATPGGKLALEAHDDWKKQMEEPSAKRQRTSF